MKRNDAAILNLKFCSNANSTDTSFIFSNEEGSCAKIAVDASGSSKVITEYVGTDVEPLYGMSSCDDILVVGGREGVVRVYQ
ncbi:hypothetical protein HK100_008345 [Physocladia obscura]|uniref:Uncharacterized protein n=1 Tax=Physocladia obscura TaxID=109957 RepID=A0AAD5T4U4_9FUNG|nr:hypothetical protein HK100_008345 [Physocladia obscura]